jgi:hypothetical protein
MSCDLRERLTGCRHVQEGAVVVEVHALEREWEQRPSGREGNNYSAALAHEDRSTFGPSRGNVGQHEGLNEVARRSRPRMGLEVDFHKTGWRVSPVADGAHRNGPPHGGPQSGPAPSALAGDSAHRLQQAIDDRGTDC